MSKENCSIEELRKERELQKDLRKKIRSEFSCLNDKINGMLKVFNEDDGSQTVTFKELSSLKYDEPYHVNEKVMFIRQRSADPNKLLFHTYMKPGGVFGKQNHDSVEHCEIVKGSLIEAMRKDKVYLQGETVTYEKFEIHKPYTDQISVYHVTFIRDANLTPES